METEKYPKLCTLELTKFPGSAYGNNCVTADTFQSCRTTLSIMLAHKL